MNLDDGETDMLMFPCMISTAASEAGMKVPSDPADFDRDKFPHFAVFCAAQLGRAMTSPHEHWENAKIIADIPDKDIRRVTVYDLINRGFMGL